MKTKTPRFLFLVVLFLPLLAFAAGDDGVLVTIGGEAEWYGSGSLEIVLGSSGASANANGEIEGETRMEPGKTYELSYNAVNLQMVTIRLNAPTGFSFYVDGVQRGSITDEQIAGVSGNTWEVELRQGTRQSVEAGEEISFSGNHEGATWRVGMGRLSNGTYASDLSFNVYPSEVSWQPYRSFLSYPYTQGETSIYRDEIGVRQIQTPSVFVDITDTPTGIRIDFYGTDAMLSSGGELKQVINGVPPFVSYAINMLDGGTGTEVIRTAGTDISRRAVEVEDTAQGVRWKTIERDGSVQKEVEIIDEDGDDISGERSVITTFKEAGTVVRKSMKRYRWFYWETSTGIVEKEELIMKVEDPDGANLVTEYKYNEDRQTIGYGRLRWVKYPDGGWIKYNYGWEGQIESTLYPWLDESPSDPDQATITNSRMVRYAYDWDWDGNYKLVRQKIETIKGKQVAKTDIQNTLHQSVDGRKIWRQKVKKYTHGTDYVESEISRYQPSSTWTDANGWQGDAELETIYDNLTYSTKRENRTQTSYAYFRGDYDAENKVFTANASGESFLEAVLSGSMHSGANAQLLSVYEGCTIDPIYMTENKSILTKRIKTKGRLLRAEKCLYTGGGFTMISYTDYDYTPSGKLIKKQGQTGVSYEATWVNERKESDMDAMGVVRSYERDAKGRLAYVHEEELMTSDYGLQPERWQRYRYNAANRVVSEDLGSPEHAEILNQLTAYDVAGRLISETNLNGVSLAISYDTANNTETTTFPDGSMRITAFYKSGQVKSVTGDGQVASYYTYGAENDGRTIIEIHYGEPNSGNWKQTIYDMAGRVISESSPTSKSGQYFFTNYTYDSNGRLARKAQTGQAAIIYHYNHNGELCRQGLDVNGNGYLDLDGMDRIREFSKEYSYENGAWWLKEEVFTYPNANDGTCFKLGHTMTRVTGFSIGLISEIHTTDSRDNNTITTKTFDANTKLTIVEQTSSLSTDIVRDIYFGTRLLGQKINDEFHLKYEHDALGRLVREIHPRTGNTTRAYEDGTNRIWKIFREGEPRDICIGTYEYDNMGRVKSFTDALGYKIHKAYNKHGLLVRIWGSATQPRSFDYDGLGRLTALHRYRGGNAWSGESWPADTGEPDTTSFNYYGDTYLLLEREEPCLDSQDQGGTISSEYDHANRLASRTNARGMKISFTYDENTGKLSSKTDHSAGTLELYTYTRFGEMSQVHRPSETEDAVYSYTYSGDGMMQLLEEYDESGQTGPLVYTYDNQNGRLLAYSLYESQTSDISTQTPDLRQQYGYRSDGRIGTITTSTEGIDLKTFTYNYGSGSERGLIKSLSSGAYVQQRAYDPRFDALSAIDTTYGGQNGTVAAYSYTYDDRGLIKTSRQAGAAFEDYGQDTFFAYDYNGRRELIAASQYLHQGYGEPVEDDSLLLPGRSYEYDYDNSGNRKSSNNSGNTDFLERMTFNAMNQLVSKENKRVHVSGTTQPEAGVKVGDVLSTRQGRFWSAEIPTDNDYGMIKENLRVVIAKPGGGSAGADLMGSMTISIEQMKALEQFTYDADGNLIKDGKWEYEYDAENRLVKMQSTTEVLLDGILPGKKLEFKYDYLGRRVKKTVYTWNNRDATWSTPSITVYRYRGWNLIAEYGTAGITHAPVLMKTHSWGLTLSGTLACNNDAGALLYTQEVGGAGLYNAIDAKGNISALLHGTNGAIMATYEYSPYGELLRAKGEYANDNPWLYSTKYADGETGLVYYGYRYYSPRMGRFINRDPIGEVGGSNLYGLGANNPINNTDHLGLCTDPRSDGENCGWCQECDPEGWDPEIWYMDEFKVRGEREDYEPEWDDNFGWMNTDEDSYDDMDSTGSGVDEQPQDRLDESDTGEEGRRKRELRDELAKRYEKKNVEKITTKVDSEANKDKKNVIQTKQIDGKPNGGSVKFTGTISGNGNEARGSAVVSVTGNGKITGVTTGAGITYGGMSADAAANFNQDGYNGANLRVGFGSDEEGLSLKGGVNWNANGNPSFKIDVKFSFKF